jgi:hypothetical protein
LKDLNRNAAMNKNAKIYFLSPLLLVLAVACASQSSPAAPMHYSQYGRPPVQARILLFLPEDFEHFVYVGTSEGGQNRYLVGLEAARELRTALGTEFAAVEVWPVRSEADALALLSPDEPGNAEVRSFDFAVIPRFSHVGSSVANQKYGFDIDLVAEFHSTDGSTVTSIRGQGESNTGKYASSSPQDGAALALQYAVAAILDGVEGRRNLFTR